LRQVPGSWDRPVPLLVSLWQWPDPPDSAARRLLDLGAAVLGINCQPGMDAAVALCRRLDRVVSCPLLVKPSAIRSAAGRPEASPTPASFADEVPWLVERTVRP